MINIPLQIQPGHKTLAVMSPEDQQALRTYGVNQVVRAQLTGYKRPRSYQQLKLYWACCRVVADNLEGRSKEDIDFDVKVALRHIKAFRIVNGVTMVEVGSISFSELQHIEACNFFDRAFPVMAKMIGVTTEKPLENAEHEPF